MLDNKDLEVIKSEFPQLHLNSENAEFYEWKTGKVVSISIDDRARMVDKFEQLGIYQIGRFGLWNRKLLIDSTIEQAKEVSLYLCGKREWSSTRELIIK